MTEGGYGPALLGCAVVVAALVIRTAVTETRRPGSARRDWAFLSTRQGWGTFLVTACVLAATTYATTGPTYLPWALLAALLITYVTSDKN
ncbi:hypothetical protein [Streptomyces roseolus]|uniref:hypothetical protein n=1 Tax=Streptomyces roseolus TaxID=67358 RepID=UPI00167398D3|nr:hypothetical protein [Streptomyces roseolus]GGR20477.1 hypothetical protein GCM10010282_11100 [Streptomyces roseolus]